ncbi:type II secretion system protein GspL [Succinimonas amylolytica]|uniref:type II secretion system protein GspL n=1 Tax=Succinimonas amylolytica TaxID=83769 RepID=UPI0023A8908D
MSEYLFLRPTLIDPRSYLWFSYDDTSHNVLATGTVNTLEELKDVGGASPDRPVVILYPVSSLKFKKVTYPGKLKKHVYEPVLYQIEDEFAEDIDNFKAHMMARSGKDYEFLIFRRNEFTDLEQALKGLGFTVTTIVPDALTLPEPVLNSPVKDKNEDNSKEIYILNIGDEWIVRDGVNSGVSVPADWLSEYVTDLPEGVSAVSLSVIPDELRERVREELTDSPLARMAEGAIHNKVNMSSYQRKRNIQFKFMTSWVKVVVMGLVFVTLWNMNMNMRISSVIRETQEYRNQQRSLFSQIMGGSGRVNDPVSRMKEILSNSSPIGTDEGFIDLVKLVSGRILNKKGIELVNMKFERSRRVFVIQFLADSGTNIDSFVSGFSPEFTGNIIDKKPSRERQLVSVQLKRRTK